MTSTPTTTTKPSPTASNVGVEQLFRDHATFVAGFLHRLGVNPIDIDDAVQDVFMVAHKKGGYILGPATPRTWLGAIATRIAVASRRSKARLRLREQYDPVAIDLAAARGHSPEQALELRDSLWRVQRALDTLDIDHRAAFVLYEIEGESCQHIAESFGVPVGTVYSRLHNARRRFAKAHADLVCASDGEHPSSAVGVA